MYPRANKLVVFACITRLAVIILQFIANVLIPDHDAAVFLYPKSNLTSSFADKTVNLLLGGFLRWDAQYFMHVAKYGYTYENTLAFFPLYPLIVKLIAVLVAQCVIFLNEDSVLLLTFVVLNIYLFIKAVHCLYELSALILNEDLAYKSAVLFCINPATVFFVAPYSESLFSYLTFKSMLNCVWIYGKHSRLSDKRLHFKSIIDIVVPIGLSGSVRSNGVLNVGFAAYFMMQNHFKNVQMMKSLKDVVIASVKTMLLLLLTVWFCLIPFMLVQAYGYYHFCKDFNHTLPDFLISFGKINNFVLPGAVSKHQQDWCFTKIPLAYSYIQDHYWNVGFMRYFEFKQIPNFVLALPIVTVILANSLIFFKTHAEYSANLGILRFKFTKLRKFTELNTDGTFEHEMFVFVVHIVFLTLFCILCIHVQVTTRMICSASPVLYWFTAYYFQYVRERSNSFKNLFLFFGNRNKIQQYLLYYFLVYCFTGTVLFANFLPWT